MGQQNSAELALVQAKGFRIPAAHPHPDMPKVPPLGVQQGLKLSSWLSFDVIALFTFPSSKIQGWLVSVQRKCFFDQSVAKKNFFLCTLTNHSQILEDGNVSRAMASNENQEDKSFKILDHAHIFVHVSLHQYY